MSSILRFHSIVQWLLVVWLHRTTAQAVQQLPAQESNNGTATPYLLFSSSNTIYRMNLNETSLPPQALYTETGIGGVVSVDYHLRLNRMFWLVGWPAPSGALKSAPLNDTSGGATILVNTAIQEPRDLAVDWINDKVYWLEQSLRRVDVYDLSTGQRSVFHQFPSNLRPNLISVFPASGYEYIFVMAFYDNLDARLLKIPASSKSTTTRITVQSEIRCPGGITLEFKTNSVFWNNYCTFLVESMKVNGTQRKTVFSRQTERPGFASFIAHYENMIYWVQGTRLYSTDISSPNSQAVEVYSNRMMALVGIQVVHPSKQPGAIVANPTTEATLPTPASSTTTTPTTPPLTTARTTTQLPTTETTTMEESTTEPLTTSSSTHEEPSSSTSAETTTETLVNEFTTPKAELGEQELSEPVITNQLLIIIIPATVGGLIIAVLLVSVVVLICCRYHHTRKGSYSVAHHHDDVILRPQKARPSSQLIASSQLNRESAASEFLWQEAPPTNPSANLFEPPPGDQTSSSSDSIATESTVESGGDQLSPLDKSMRLVHI